MAVIGFCFTKAQNQAALENYRLGQGGILLSELESLGHKIVNFDDPNVEIFLSLDHRPFPFRKISRLVPASRRLLFVQEPFVVIPSNYKSRIRKKYGKIISITPAGADYSLPWPQYPWYSPPLHNSDIRDRNSILINSNKVSCLKGSQYGFRRKLVSEFRKRNLPLVLCGPNWNRGIFKSSIENLKALAYSISNFQFPVLSELAFPVLTNGSVNLMGPIPDKQAVMSKSTFALVVENQDNYISEKIFDAVFAGCVPLYLGPSLKSFGIPEDIAFELSRDVASFADIVINISEEEIQSKLSAGKSWINSNSTKEQWSAESVYFRAAIQIDSWINTLI